MGAAARQGPDGVPQVLNRLADLAARLVDAPSAQVSLLVGDQVVRFDSPTQPGAGGAPALPVDSLCEVAVQQQAVLVVPDVHADARVRHLIPVASGAVGAYLGVPLPSSQARFTGVVCAVDPNPRAWRPQDVAALRQLARSVVVELELAEVTSELELAEVTSELELAEVTSSTCGDLALRAAGIGTFDSDLTTGRVTWDRRMHELFDYEPGTFDGTLAAFEARLHPDDLSRTRAVVEAAIRGRGLFDLEHRVLCQDGSTRFVHARGRVLVDEQGEPVQILGAAYDTTAASASEASVVRLLELMPAAFYALDRDWRFTFVNRAAEALLRVDRADLLGRNLWELFPDFCGSTTERCFRDAVDTGEPATFEQPYLGATGPMTLEIHAWPGPEGLSVYASDITQRRADEERVAQSAQRSALLATVSAELAGTLEPAETMQRLARLVVPQLADWAVVSLLDVDAPSRWQRALVIRSWHPDPARRPLLAEFAELRLTQLVVSPEVLAQMRQGKMLSVPQGAAEWIMNVLQPGRARELVRQLGPASLRLLPLQAHGRTLGMLTLFSDSPDAPFDEELAMQVADRAALALDNARLYAEQRRLSEGLQRSLLTAPPQPDHVQIVVRYESAAQVAQVGGDWYDAFLQRDGATVLVIGDVVGHDTVAAAAMGQLRGLLRAIGARGDHPPITVLTELDAVMEVLEVDTTATAVVARLEQDPEQLGRDEITLRWSNAGHPPPMVVRPDGCVQVLDPPAGSDADLLLGFDAGTERTESTLRLPAGSTVLLYSDGLVERRPQSLDEGITRLFELLRELGDLPLDELCDQLLHRMLPQNPEDDVALVAVRLHPHDQARPADADPPT